ncbi:MAG: response regulator [Actinobacteria bacterium]|nr:response regulator [Actinomycetota bacterium]MBU1942144.1 response regulator [Actinomycetota bacterium]MBU2686672.1 response regulator [Actinomycetota bacterium]
MAERLLIIEDEETVADILALNLELEGFEVEKAYNGTSGLSAALEGRFDLVICDVMMPDLDGYELCRRLKGDERTGATPVILLTARTDVENKVAGLDAGADDFVTKPFEFDDLLGRINMNLDRAASRYTTDKLTGFPGNISADDELRARVLSRKPFAMMLVTVNSLRPLREVYGDEACEKVMRFTADTMRAATGGLSGRGDMAAYLGSGSFCLITSPDRAVEYAEKIVRRFDAGVLAFYSEAERKTGIISTFDRQGDLIDNPLMTVSIGIASNAHRRIRSHWEAAEIAREVLDHAMTFPGSKYVADRRTDDTKKT